MHIKSALFLRESGAFIVFPQFVRVFLFEIFYTRTSEGQTLAAISPAAGKKTNERTNLLSVTRSS